MRKNLLGGLAHIIVAVEKSHDRSPLGLRAWNASSLAQSKSKSLSTTEGKGMILNSISNSLSASKRGASVACSPKTSN